MPGSAAARQRPAALVVGLALVAAVMFSAVALDSPVAAATVASTRSYTLGSDGLPFTLASPVSPLFAVSGTTSPALKLNTGISLQLTAATAGYTGQYARDPRSVQGLASGDVLIADRQNRSVLELRPDGSLAWSFTDVDDPALQTPFSAQRLSNGDTLITDRGACKVIEVNQAKQIVWQYGGPPSPIDAPPGINQLADPFSAVRLANGNTLICDNKGGNRVIEVRDSDYDPSKPDDGYTAASIVWQYGVTGKPGGGPGEVNSPRSAYMMANGDVLICDGATQSAGDGSNRVIEVRTSDYDATQPNDGWTAGSIIWQIDATHPLQGGAGSSTLNDPNQALPLANGNVLITDGGNNRVIEVNQERQVVAEFGPKTVAGYVPLQAPRGASLLPDGRIIIADQGDQRVIAVGAVASATVQTAPIDLGMSGTLKEFLGLHWQASGLSSADSLTISYRIDNHAWRPVSGHDSMQLPAGTAGRSITFRVALSSKNSMVTPVLSGLAVSYRLPISASNAGASAGTGAGAGGSGIGLATAGGSHGTGTGSGTGRGAQSGATTTVSGSQSTNPANTAAAKPADAAAPATVPPTPTTATGGAQQISGLRVNESGSRAGGQTGGSGHSKHGSSWYLTVALVLAGLTAATAAPAFIVRRRLRYLTTYDHLARHRRNRVVLARIPLLDE
ncbi:MAG: hypothetical protein ACLQUT_06360 [Thermoleophilia bacterium]